MTTRRLYAPSLPSRGGLVELTGSHARHVSVLRMRAGDPLVLFDGEGCEAVGRIESIDADRVLCHAEAPRQTDTGMAHVVLMLALPKGSKVDDCVRMATELGVGEVVLMQTERTVPRWDPRRIGDKISRLGRIAQEAAAQSERSDVPVIHPPETCAQWLERFPSKAQGVVFAARAGRPMPHLSHRPKQWWCAIGPEGGFTDDEVAAFRSAGFAVASLGSRILRVETAVPAALAVLADRLRAL